MFNEIEQRLFKYEMNTVFCK